MQATVSIERDAERIHVVAGLRNASPEGEAAFLAALAEAAIATSAAYLAGAPRDDRNPDN